jgi:putative endonuclease
VTNDLFRRIFEHRWHLNPGFSARYYLHDLVYYEMMDDISVAIAREKQLKNWHRAWKRNLIRSMNPTMEDLAADWFDDYLIPDQDPEMG